MISSGRSVGPAVAPCCAVRSICIHRSYGIKYTRHVHESDNCHSCSTDVSINRVRSFALARPLRFARSFVRPFVRSFVRVLVHSLAPSSARFHFFFLYPPRPLPPHLLSFSAALFIAIIPRYALAPHPRGSGDSGVSRYSFCTSRPSTERGRNPAGEKNESARARAHVATGRRKILVGEKL